MAKKFTLSAKPDLKFRIWRKQEFGDRSTWSGYLYGNCWARQKAQQTLNWILKLNDIPSNGQTIMVFKATPKENPKGVFIRFEVSSAEVDEKILADTHMQ